MALHVGRVSTWLILPCVVYLLVSFPERRIAPGLDRVLLTGVFALCLTLFVGTTPLVTAFPAHTVWASCTTDCPPNALALVDHPPALLANVILVREWLVEAVWIGLFISMWRRWRAASLLQQRTLAPVFVFAVAMGLCHIAFHTSRQLGAPAEFVVGLSSAWTLCIVAVCAAILLGLFRRRMLLADTLARLSVALRVSSAYQDVRDASSVALNDASIELLFRDRKSGEWRDTSGRAVAWPPSPAAGRAVTILRYRPARPARWRWSTTLPCATTRNSSTASAAWCWPAGASRNSWPTSPAPSRDLEDSRRRIAEAADSERARIERDLHDGAQQRLIALRIKVTLAEDQLKADGSAAALRDDSRGSASKPSARWRNFRRSPTACTHRCSPTEVSPTR